MNGAMGLLVHRTWRWSIRALMVRGCGAVHAAARNRVLLPLVRLQKERRDAAAPVDDAGAGAGADAAPAPKKKVEFTEIYTRKIVGSVRCV